MNNMYAVFHQFGSPQQVVQLEQRQASPPQADEIAVRMLARPINPSDLIPITGAYAHRIALPCIPGYEGVGVVEAIGAAVDRRWLGRRVLPLRGEGTWQQYVKAPAQYAVAVPEWIDDVIAAQLYINPVTAWVLLVEELGLRAGDTLIINAAASSIGMTIAQMCRVLGYRLIAVTSSRMQERDRMQEQGVMDERGMMHERGVMHESSTIQKHKLLELGAAYVLDASMNEASLRAAVMELTNGQGADAAIDCIGGSAGNAMAACLRGRATFISLGLLSGQSVNWEYLHQELQLKGKLFHLRHWNERSSSEQWHQTFRQIMSMLHSGQLVLPQPAASFALTEVKQAIAYSEASSRQQGKVLLTSS